MTVFALSALVVMRLVVLAAAPAAPSPPTPVPAAASALSEEPFPPHQVADNLYYVGSRGLASYLVTTRQGHILINPSFESTVPLLRSNVEKLGFKFTDVKILLNSHAHSDHAAGMALARKLTNGADVYVMKGDDKTVETGAGDGPQPWKPTPVKRVMADGDKVTLGGATLTAVHTPGHTRGCTTWTMRVKLGGKDRNAVVVCSPNVNPNYRLVDDKAAGFDPGVANAYFYPEIVRDYEKSFRIWKRLPCDIFLGAHGNYYDMEAKHQRLVGGQADAFVDPKGYRAYIEERERAFRARLDEQQKQLAAASKTVAK
jgi:metallo-beta-lactamase class B